MVGREVFGRSLVDGRDVKLSCEDGRVKLS